MGILVAGLIGQVRNKVGNMVFSNWKGINTARAYAVPANPQSVDQTAQRTKFATVVSLAQNLLGTLITTFVNPFAVKMSGFNMFISMFIANATSDGLATSSCQVTKGTLESASPVTSTYNTATGEVAIQWDPTVSGNGLGTDLVGCLVLDEATNEIIGYNPGTDTRSGDTKSITVATGLLASDLIAYFWFHRGTGSSFIVSNSVGTNVVTS